MPDAGREQGFIIPAGAPAELDASSSLSAAEDLISDWLARRSPATGRAYGRDLDATQGDVRRTKHFSRHARLDTVALDDNARRELAGEVATLLSAVVGEAIPDKPEAEGGEVENTHDRAHAAGSKDDLQALDSNWGAERRTQ